MKKILTIMVLYCGMVLMTSCDKDLLDIEQHGALSPDTFYANATDAQADQLITTVYRTMYNRSGNDVTDGDDGVTRTANVNVNSQNAGSNGDFTELYRINYLCNLIIENMPGDTDKKRQVIGEAYFWRAFAYIELITGWGTPPLVDHVLSPDELEPANGQPAELWAYVESSLDEAIALLPAKPGLGQQQAIGGRVTKGAATAVLGKAQ
ncbi:MAG: RagB/SusD family nutrient uptake outer membrane protein, partial [Bacteroidales bacterium]